MIVNKVFLDHVVKKENFCCEKILDGKKCGSILVNGNIFLCDDCWNKNISGKVKIEEHAELNPFNQNFKSSVKIIKNTKGFNFEVKVCTGEKHLMSGLLDEAIDTYKELIKKTEGMK
jgi:hypothetical protein